ncbi:MAG: SPW repeat protein [Alphaproteobacteria bacterium]|nr:SPW repeat protein [Alphaproteobacteria bacterium]
MKAFRWRSMVTLIVAIGVLLSAWMSLGHINVVFNVYADDSIQEIAALLTTFAAAFLLLLALLSLVLRKAWLAGLRLLVGIWFVVSPWVLGHGMGSVPTLILIAGGIAVVAVAAFDLYRGFRHEGDVLSHMS